MENKVLSSLIYAFALTNRYSGMLRAVRNPVWATIPHGIFICFDCAAVHRKFNLRFVRCVLFLEGPELRFNFWAGQLRWTPGPMSS